MVTKQKVIYEPQITKTMIVVILIMSLSAIGIGTYVEIYQGGIITNETKDMAIYLGQIGLWFLFPMLLLGYYIERNQNKVCRFIYNKRTIE